MNQRIKRILSLMMSLFMIFGCFTTNIFSANQIFGNNLVYAEENNESNTSFTFDGEVLDPFREASEKIEPAVKEQLESLKKDDFIDVLVYMNNQVDSELVAYETQRALSLMSTTPYQTKLAVRRNIVEALKSNAETSQANALAYLEKEMEKGNVEKFQSFFSVSMIQVKATKEVIENLTYMADVEKIYCNDPVQIDTMELSKSDTSSTDIEWNISRVRAPEVWGLGYDGTGVVVANIDSGVQWNHPALINKWRSYDPETGKVVQPELSWFDGVANTTLPIDEGGHGTHVMGTMVGSEEDGKNQIGVAPGAKWIAARVFDKDGYSVDRSVFLAVGDWMLAPGGNVENAPDVINNSWGGLSGMDHWFREVVKKWRDAGIVPVFAAGNQRTGEPAPEAGSITVPANYPESIAVGATDIYDKLGDFSKLGPSPYCPDKPKPDLSAPGVKIRSSVPGSLYEAGWNGTSMAAPAVSGVVALIMSANQSLTVDQIEEILKDTARPLTDSKFPTSPNMGYGYGIVDAFEAVAQIAPGTGYIEGTVLVSGEDNESAVIIHEQEVEISYEGFEVDIIADISDDISVLETKLLVKREDSSDWNEISMDIISGDHKNGKYRGTITEEFLAGLDEKSITYKISAKDYSGKITVSQDYNIDIKFGIVPGEYSMGFEDSIYAWTLTGTDAWEIGIPTYKLGPNKAFEGEKLAATVLNGPYQNNADSWLISPPIDLRNLDNSLKTASLRFYEWYNLKAPSDKGHVLITNDDGETWTELRLPITGIRQEWKEAYINLNDYIGSQTPVYVAFKFASDYYGQSAGWYIDNVSLVSLDNEAPAAPTNLIARVDSSEIELTWNKSTEPDADKYNVYRKTESDANYVKLADTRDITYVDSDIVSGTTYYYVVTAVDFSGNESAYSQEVVIEISGPVTLFSTDFEDDDGNFETELIKGSLGNPWEWGIPTSPNGPGRAGSGYKLWATNLAEAYPRSTDAYIETPEITIPSDKQATLHFTHWFDFDGSVNSPYDYGQVLISRTNGLTWKNLTPDTFGKGGKYSTRLKTWLNEEIPLIGYNGDTIKIRFLFHSDTSTNYDGWYIDDVKITADPYIGPPRLESEEIKYDDGSAENYVTTAKNNGMAVRFTPSQLGKVTSVKIHLHGEDYPNPGGNRLGFLIFDSNGVKQGDPIWVDNLVRGDWNTVDLSSLNYITDIDFYISTVQDGDAINFPAVSVDTNSVSDQGRSYFYSSGRLNLTSKKGDNFMIRANMDYTVTNEGDSLSAIESDYTVDNAADFNLNILRNTKEIESESFEKVQSLSGEFKQSSTIGIPAKDAVITIVETGRSVKVDPSTGKFTLRVKAGEYTLRADSYGYLPLTKSVTVDDDQAVSVDFMLETKPQGTIRGRVFDRYNNEPVVGANVRLVEDAKIPSVYTDLNGEFEIPNVYIGEYTLKIKAEEFYSGEENVIVVENNVASAQIGLKRFVGFSDEISYDDGTVESRGNINGAGNGLAVRFTTEEMGRVRGLNINIYGVSPTPAVNELGFAIFDSNQRQVGEIIWVDDLQKSIGSSWEFIDLSSIDFITNEDFYIASIQLAEGSQSPKTSLDTNEESNFERSFIYDGSSGEFIPLNGDGFIGSIMMRAVVDYIVDTPVITNLSSINYTNQDVIRVEGMLSFDGQVKVYVNDTEQFIVNSKNKTFSTDITLIQETTTISVAAVLDGVETERSELITVIKDQEAPLLLVTSPENNAIYNAEVAHVIGSVSDNISLAKLEINGEEYEADENGNFHERVILDIGSNIITVVATDMAGNTTEETRTVIVVTEGQQITDITPDTDLMLRQGETLTISFKAPEGGQGYYEILTPFAQFDIKPNSFGTPMTYSNGVYTGTWIAPEGFVATDIEIQVVYVSRMGEVQRSFANGKLSVIGRIEDMASNSVIVDQEAFDINYLNKSSYAQVKLIRWINSNKEIYIKINENTIVTETGVEASIDNLPDFITYYDEVGNVFYFEK